MSSFFSNYPVVTEYTVGDTVLDVMDITKRTGILAAFRTDPSTYVEYTIKDGETAIVLADRVYDDPNLYWVILLFNDIFDIEDQWPMDIVTLEDYINRVYDDPEATREYRSSFSGNVVDASHSEYDRVAITHRQFEFEQNELKRKIKIPVPEAISLITTQHKRLIQQ